MNFFIFDNNSLLAKKTSQKLRSLLIKLGYSEIVDFNKFKDLDILLIIGGDGAFLYAFHDLFNYLNFSKTKFLPIQTGSIGRLSTYKIDDLDNLKQNFILKKFTTKKESALKIQINDKTFFAVNEIKIFEFLKPILFDVFVDKTKLLTHFGSGLFFASSLGSTGYSKSFHGPIIFDNPEIFLLSELVPVDNRRHRSLNAFIILDKRREVSLKIKKNQLKNLKITADIFNIPFDINSDLEIKVSLVKNYLELIVEKETKDTLIFKKLEDIFL